MRLWTRSLRARLIGHFSLMSLVIVALVGALAFVRARLALQDAVVQRLTVIATLQEDQLHRWVDRARRDVVYLASSLEARALAARLLRDRSTVPVLDHPAYASLAELFGHAKDHQVDLSEIFILAEIGGEIVFSTDPGQVGDYRVRDRFFTEGLQGTFMQTVYPSPMTFEPTLTIATPLFDPQGGRLGVFAAHLNLQEIDRIIDEPGELGESGETYLVDAYNDFISGERFGREQHTRGVHTKGIDMAVAGADGFDLYANYAGTPVIGVYRWIDELELALMVEVAQAEAFAPARRIAAWILGFGLGLGLLMTAATFVMARQITRPVVLLTRAAVEVADGELATQVPELTEDEIGTLARTFNEMTERLRTLYGDLKDEIAVREKAEQTQQELITELESRNAELEHLNAELERFNYTISHDLRNPLVTIRGFLGLIEKDALAGDHERLQRDLEAVRKATEMMSDLLHDLLELSRVGRTLNPPEDVELGKLVSEVRELLAGSIEQRGVEIVIAGELPVVSADRVRLREVFQNLIENAVKYMGDTAEPRVEIGISEDGGGVQAVFVRDNGLGIEPRYQDKIFGLFERLEAGVDGTGVGLALVKRIIEMHGGRIWVESTGEGHGSTFYFTLDPSPDAEQAPDAA